MLRRTRPLLGALAMTFACGGGGGAPDRAPPSPAPRGAAADTSWRFQVRVGPGADELHVEASLPAGVPAELGVDDGAEPFVADLTIETSTGATPLSRSGTSWMAPACRAGGCRLRYRFRLRDAARAIEDDGVAAAHRGAILAPPSTWLVRPLGAPAGARYRFDVTDAADASFATGVQPVEGARGSYEADVSDLPEAPYSAFGALQHHHLPLGPDGRALEVVILPGALAGGDAPVLRGIEEAARAVSAYYERFPVPRALVIIVPRSGSGFGYARTLGNGGASILAPLGMNTDAAHLAADWVMTHEMVHLGFPNLARRHTWLEEGIATYVEPLARARIGQLAVAEVWRSLLRGLPRGLPQPGDEGLDHTPTWGRRYWGGALFCLLADLQIRERTAGARSLDDALRAINRAGGDVSARWEIDRALSVGDAGTGVTVLRELYEQMAHAPVAVDLPALWARLGVSIEGGEVRFDDTAPLAGVRRALTATRSPAPGP